MPEEPTLEQLEEEQSLSDETAHIPPSDIVAFNELRSCADLFRMYTQKILQLQPDFQREVVWAPASQTRFVDSLIKQLPIPSMCFAMDYKAQRWIVIDGLQRISTIVRFLEGGNWTLSSLEDIDPELAGQSVAAIKTSTGPLHGFYSRVENLTIPITVLRCDFKKKSHMQYLFTIFHRLNTGGVKLNNQEIRNCIYGGTLNMLLRELDEYTSWRAMNDLKPGEKYRFTKQEIILRMFAFYDRLTQYEGNLAGFINEYMQDFREADEAFLDQKRKLFIRTTDWIHKKLFPNGPIAKLSISVLEALLYGVAKNIDHLETLGSPVGLTLYQDLLAEPEFSESALREGLAKKPRVQSRLSTAERIFAR